MAIIEVVKEQGLERVMAYLDDTIVYHPDAAAHTANTRALFQHICLHNLKLPVTEVIIEATEADSLGHAISPASIILNADKIAALTEMPMPSNVKQTRALIGGIDYCHRFFGNPCTRLINTALLKQEGKNIFTPVMEATAREILRELAAPPILDCPGYDAVANNSRPFHLYCDATRDGFGATPEQKQPDGSVRPILFVNCATLDSERSWSPFNLEAGSIVWATKWLRGHLWSTKVVIYSDHKALENIAKVGEPNAWA